MSKYLADQARDREQRRERLRGLRGLPITDAPAPPPTSSRPIETSTGLDALLQQIVATMAPKGVAQTPGPELKVAPGGVSRASGDGGGGYQDEGGGGGGGLGGLLDNMLKAQKTNESGQKGASVRDRSATAAAERAQRLRDTTPGPYAKGAAATQYVQEKIPGLKPGIPTPPPTAEGKPTAPPSEPAARAYLEQQRTDIPPIRMTEKGTTPSATGDRVVLGNDEKGLDILAGVDPRVMEIVSAAAEALPPGYKIQPTSGVRKEGQGQHTKGKAVDWQIIDPDGKPISNRGDDSTGLYTKLAKNAYGYQEQNHPDLNGKFNWGGAFGTSAANPEEPDLMHFDIGGRRGHITKYSRETIGTEMPPSAKAPGPELPPWDKGLPQQDAKTNWPSPTATTSADQIKATPVATGPQAATGDQTLAAQRADYKAQADANPQLRETMAAIMISESSTPEGQQGTAEAMMNRVKANNRPFTDAMDPNYHADYMVRNRGKFDAAVAKIRNDPQLRERIYGLQDKAFNGSNVSKLATDYAGAGVAERSAKTSTETYASPDGQRFFRKDLDPVNDGPGQVAANKKWHAETTAAMEKPSTPADPGTGPLANAADKGSPLAMARDVVEPGKAGTVKVGGGQITSPDSATPVAGGAKTTPDSAPPSASVFEKGTTAVPVSGAGGLQEGADEPATTGATLYPDKDTAALNEIKPAAPAVAPAPPAAAAGAVTPAAAAPSAPAPVTAAPPPPAQATRAPPPPPPKAAAAPPLTPAQVAASQPKPAANPAHRFLDMNTVAFAEYIKKGAGSQVPGMVSGMTVREVVNHPIFGGMAKAQLGEGLKAVGITEKQFNDAVKEGKPPPGKQSAAEQPRATEFSARAKTPLAPPGLDGKQPTAAEREGMETMERMKINMEAQKAGRPERLPLSGPAPGRPDLPPEPGQKTVPTDETGGLPDLPMSAARDDNKATLDPASQPAVQDAEGNISTVRTVGVNVDGKEVNLPTVSPTEKRIVTPAEAVEEYRKTGKHLGKYDTPEEAGAAAEALHQQEAQQISQHPQGQQPTPTMTPEMAKAFEDALKDQARIPQGPPIPPDAQPVLPSSQPGGAGAGLSLAPPGLQNLSLGPTAPGAGPFQSAFTPGSQGGAIATAGIMPQTGVFSTPLLDAAAQQQPSAGFGASSFSPIAPQFMSWGSGLGGSSGASGFGGLYGDSFGGAMDTSAGSMNFTPMTWGG